ncbi:unnamed protein product [Amoebophrya sp. A120]|nr:unnamed protein product [Amoebophrya sp. A120]|eukprot:GSA120T00002925001.1
MVDGKLRSESAQRVPAKPYSDAMLPSQDMFPPGGDQLLSATAGNSRSASHQRTSCRIAWELANVGKIIRGLPKRPDNGGGSRSATPAQQQPRNPNPHKGLDMMRRASGAREASCGGPREPRPKPKTGPFCGRYRPPIRGAHGAAAKSEAEKKMNLETRQSVSVIREAWRDKERRGSFSGGPMLVGKEPGKPPKALYHYGPARNLPKSDNPNAAASEAAEFVARQRQAAAASSSSRRRERTVGDSRGIEAIPEDMQRTKHNLRDLDRGFLSGVENLSTRILSHSVDRSVLANLTDVNKELAVAPKPTASKASVQPEGERAVVYPAESQNFTIATPLEEGHGGKSVEYSIEKHYKFSAYNSPNSGQRRIRKNGFGPHDFQVVSVSPSPPPVPEEEENRDSATKSSGSKTSEPPSAAERARQGELLPQEAESAIISDVAPAEIEEQAAAIEDPDEKEEAVISAEEREDGMEVVDDNGLRVFTTPLAESKKQRPDDQPSPNVSGHQELFSYSGALRENRTEDPPGNMELISRSAKRNINLQSWVMTSAEPKPAVKAETISRTRSTPSPPVALKPPVMESLMQEAAAASRGGSAREERGAAQRDENVTGEQRRETSSSSSRPAAQRKVVVPHPDMFRKTSSGPPVIRSLFKRASPEQPPTSEKEQVEVFLASSPDAVAGRAAKGARLGPGKAVSRVSSGTSAFDGVPAPSPTTMSGQQERASSSSSQPQELVRPRYTRQDDEVGRTPQDNSPTDRSKRQRLSGGSVGTPAVASASDLNTLPTVNVLVHGDLSSAVNLANTAVNNKRPSREGRSSREKVQLVPPALVIEDHFNNEFGPTGDSVASGSPVTFATEDSLELSEPEDGPTVSVAAARSPKIPVPAGVSAPGETTAAVSSQAQPERSAGAASSYPIDHTQDESFAAATDEMMLTAESQKIDTTSAPLLGGPGSAGEHDSRASSKNLLIGEQNRSNSAGAAVVGLVSKDSSISLTRTDLNVAPAVDGAVDLIGGGAVESRVGTKTLSLDGTGAGDHLQRSGPPGSMTGPGSEDGAAVGEMTTSAADAPVVLTRGQVANLVSAGLMKDGVGAALLANTAGLAPAALVRVEDLPGLGMDATPVLDADSAVPLLGTNINPADRTAISSSAPSGAATPKTGGQEEVFVTPSKLPEGSPVNLITPPPNKGQTPASQKRRLTVSATTPASGLHVNILPGEATPAEVPEAGTAQESTSVAAPEDAADNADILSAPATLPPTVPEKAPAVPPAAKGKGKGLPAPPAGKKGPGPAVPPAKGAPPAAKKGEKAPPAVPPAKGGKATPPPAKGGPPGKAGASSPAPPGKGAPVPAGKKGAAIPTGSGDGKGKKTKGSGKGTKTEEETASPPPELKYRKTAIQGIEQGDLRPIFWNPVRLDVNKDQNTIWDKIDKNPARASLDVIARLFGTSQKKEPAGKKTNAAKGLHRLNAFNDGHSGDALYRKTLKTTPKKVTHFDAMSGQQIGIMKSKMPGQGRDFRLLRQCFATLTGMDYEQLSQLRSTFPDDENLAQLHVLVEQEKERLEKENREYIEQFAKNYVARTVRGIEERIVLEGLSLTPDWRVVSTKTKPGGSASDPPPALSSSSSFSSAAGSSAMDSANSANAATPSMVTPRSASAATPRSVSAATPRDEKQGGTSNKVSAVLQQAAEGGDATAAASSSTSGNRYLSPDTVREIRDRMDRTVERRRQHEEDQLAVDELNHSDVEYHLDLRTKPALGEVEEYCLHMLQIPDFRLRLQVWVTTEDYPALYQDASQNVRYVIDACDFLLHSPSVVRLFATCVEMGNYMNAGNKQRERADGFVLDITQQMKQIKTTQKSLGEEEFAGLLSKKAGRSRSKTDPGTNLLRSTSSRGEGQEDAGSNPVTPTFGASKSLMVTAASSQNAEPAPRSASSRKRLQRDSLNSDTLSEDEDAAPHTQAARITTNPGSPAGSLSSVPSSPKSPTSADEAPPSYGSDFMHLVKDPKELPECRDFCDSLVMHAGLQAIQPIFAYSNGRIESYYEIICKAARFNAADLAKACTALTGQVNGAINLTKKLPEGRVDEPLIQRRALLESKLPELAAMKEMLAEAEDKYQQLRTYYADGMGGHGKAREYPDLFRLFQDFFTGLRDSYTHIKKAKDRLEERARRQRSLASRRRASVASGDTPVENKDRRAGEHSSNVEMPSMHRKIRKRNSIA